MKLHETYFVLLKRKTKNDFLIVLASTFILIFMIGLSKSCYAKKTVYLGEAAIKAKMKKKKEEQKKKLFKSAYTVSHITKKEIAATQNPMMGIVNVLNQKPSIHVTTSGPNGVRTHIYMRAFNGGQITEEFDGIPLNSLFDGSAQNYASVRNNVPFTIGDVSSVNIYRGINNPSVNSFNSLGGTINFNPLMPSRKFGVSLFGGYGSYATRQYGVALNSGKLPYGVRIYLRATKNDSNGWMQNTGDKNDSYYMSILKPYNMGRSNISFIYMRNDNTGFTPHSVPLPLEQQYGYTFNWPSNVSNSYNIDESWYAILGWNDYVNKHLRFQNKAFYHYNHYYRVSYTNPQCITKIYNNPANPDYNSATNGECSAIAQNINGAMVQPFYLPNQPESWAYPSSTNSYNPEALFPDGGGDSLYGTDNHLYLEYMNEYGDIPSFTIKAPRNKITLGGQFLIGTIRSAEYWYGNSNVPQGNLYNDAWNEHDTRANDTVYIQDKISVIPKRFFVEPGFKYNTVNTTAADNPGYYYSIGGTESNVYNYFEPSLGLSYNLLKNWVIYGAWGKIQKVPNIGAYYGLIGAATLNGAPYTPPFTTVKPEYITDYELGTRYKYNNLKLSVNGYKEDFLNTFSYAYNQSLGVSLEYNAGNSMYEGIELQAGYKINRISGVFANWSYNTAIYTTNYAGNYGTILSGEHIANVPRHLANLGGYLNLFKTYLKIWGTYSGQQYLNNSYGSPTDEYHIGGYWVFNGYLSHYFNFKNIRVLKNAQFKGVKISLSINNILNRNYNAWASIGYNSIPGNPNYTYETAMPGLPRFVMVNATIKF